MSILSHFELRQYTNSKDHVEYHVVGVNDDGSTDEMMIDSYSYNRAKTEGKHIASACNCKLFDKTSRSDLFNAREMAEAHALMQKGN